MKTLLILAALCTLTTAMVPRLKRAIDEDQVATQTQICLPQTPCGWVFYREHPEQVISTKSNADYCHCASNMVCDVDEDDREAKSLIQRCKLES